MIGAHSARIIARTSLAETSKQAFMVLEKAIAAGQKAGVMRSGEPKQLAWAAWSVVHGLAMLLLDGQLPVTENREIDSLSSFITRMLVEGLAKLNS